MDKALADNLDVKMALARIDQARAERRGTRAELFPTVNVTAGAQRQRQSASRSGTRHQVQSVRAWVRRLMGN